MNKKNKIETEKKISKKEMICIDKKIATKMIWDLDLLADELISQGNYYKKRVQIIKNEMEKGTCEKQA